MRLSLDEGLVYPGGIKPEEIPATALLNRSLSISLRAAYSGRDCLSPVEGVADQLGYEKHPVGKAPTFDEYSLPPASRIDKVSRPLCVSCVAIWEQRPGCNVVEVSADNAAMLQFGWQESNFSGPGAAWASYDVVARKIAQSIFIDRPMGDFQ